jgi:CheY-like chemotaxis protein
VRTPLNSIINYLEVALEETLDERSRQHLQNSLQASKSLVFVVNDLLNLTEAEDVDFDIYEDNVDLRSLIREVITAFNDESTRKSLEIRLSEDEAVPTTVRCDPAGLRQVVSNLLDNAIKYSSNGLIRISLCHLSDTDANTLVEISFEDTGKGLSEMELDRIFQDFEQILDEDEDQASGHEDKEQLPNRQTTIGLGLAFTARFVRLNRGQISISSEEGRGARVSIKIPFRRAFHGDFRKKRALAEISLPTPPTDILTPDSTEHSFKSISTSFPISERSLSKGSTPTEFLSSSKEKEITTGRLSPGSGSATTLPLNTIPTSLPELISANDQYSFPIVDSTQRKLRILIAEDNPLNSRILETRLSKRGHEMKITVNGQACVDAFKTSPEFFDVILMDLQVCLQWHIYLLSFD